MITPNFTQEQVREMYQILVEIHDALVDKSSNTGANRINMYEGFWLYGIEEILDKIHDEKIPAMQDLG